MLGSSFEGHKITAATPGSKRNRNRGDNPCHFHRFNLTPSPLIASPSVSVECCHRAGSRCLP